MRVAIPTQLGCGALFGLVFGESAGVPLPGETALVAASLLAPAGHPPFPVDNAAGAIAWAVSITGVAAIAGATGAE